MSQPLSADHTYTAIACTPHLTTFTHAYNLGLETDSDIIRWLVFSVGSACGGKRGCLLLYYLPCAHSFRSSPQQFTLDRFLSLTLSLSPSRCSLAPPRPPPFPTPTPQMTLVARNIAQAMGGDAEVHYYDGYPATVNHAAQTAKARAVAEAVVGVENVTDACPPTMGAEDFSYLLQERPGCYVWLGQARGGEEGAGDAWDATARALHNTGYDFNDANLPVGASFFASLVETLLPRARS